MGKFIRGKKNKPTSHLLAGGLASLALVLGACNSAPGATPASAPPSAPSGQDHAEGPGFQASTDTYRVDFRMTPAHTLSEAEQQRLGTEPAVVAVLSNGQEVRYANVGGVMLIDGDAALNKSGKAYHELLRLDAQANRFGAQSISIFPENGDNWGDTIPYYWRSGEFTAEQEAALQRGIQRWNEQVGGTVRWVWSTNFRDGVRFIRGDGNTCGWSYLGSIGGAQDISISCFTNQTIIHEMGHAAGLPHEHTRCDRDNYISIPPRYLDNSNFYKNCRAYEYGPYDYDSVMNYGQPFMYPLDNPSGSYNGTPSNLGRTTELSPGDIRTIQLSFTGSATEPTDPTTPTEPETPIFENTYTGTLGSGDTGVTNYFAYSGGTLEGKLTGPAGTDFDLYLQRWNGNAWVYVASSEGPTSAESIRYRAGAGHYRWNIYAYEGSGEFTLGENR